MELNKAYFDDPLQKSKVVYVRRLNKSDYEMVCNISKDIRIYFGKYELDYLPKRYLRWLDTGIHFFYGVFIDDELIGLSARRLLDGNKTIWAEAGRVTTKYRGKGYYNVLKKGVQQLYSAPTTIQKGRAIRSAQTDIALEKFQKRPNFVSSIYHIMTVLNDDIKPCVIKRYQDISPIKKQRFKSVSSDELFTLLQNSKEEAFYPKRFNNTLIIDFVAYEINQANLNIIEYGGCGEYPHEYLVEYKEGHDDVIVSFSLTGVHERMSGQVINSIVYCSDFESYICHTYNHIMEPHQVYSVLEPDPDIFYSSNFEPSFFQHDYFQNDYFKNNTIRNFHICLFEFPINTPLSNRLIHSRL